MALLLGSMVADCARHGRVLALAFRQEAHEFFGPRAEMSATEHGGKTHFDLRMRA